MCGVCNVHGCLIQLIDGPTKLGDPWIMQIADQDIKSNTHMVEGHCFHFQLTDLNMRVW